MMGRMDMGKQTAAAPASRLPVVTELDKARAMGATPQAAPQAAPPGAPTKMAKGGKVTRGDGCCMKGKTKGKRY